MRRATGAGGAGVWMALALASTAQGAADEPFESLRLRAGGRPVEVVARRSEEGGAVDLLVACVEGTPPEERRRLDLFRAGDLRAGRSTPALRLVAPADAVGFDVADLDPTPGDEIVLLSRDALEILGLGRGGARVLRRVALEPQAPLPSRTRSLTRLPSIGDWDSDGRLEALVPSLGGVRLVELDGSAARELALPLRAEYFTPDRGPPPYDGILELELEWPRLALGDDDGDGRLDLFALGRYGVAVFRAREPGAALPTSPDRSMPLQPLTLEEELQHETTQVRLFADDLDGDGLADLVVHRAAGQLLASRASTEVHRNPGAGADLARPPDARIPVEAGVSAIEIVDVDGDGRREILHSGVRFGVVQLVRVLATRRAEVELAVYAVEGPGVAGLRRVWRREVALPLDFRQGRPEGLLPRADGDWNADGRRDLLLGEGGGALGLWLGRAGPDGADFGGPSARAATSRASKALVGDVDGDGLQDLVLYDDRDVGGVVQVLRNRGALPGTPAGMRAATPP